VAGLHRLLVQVQFSAMSIGLIGFVCHSCQHAQALLCLDEALYSLLVPDCRRFTAHCTGTQGPWHANNLYRNKRYCQYSLRCSVRTNPKLGGAHALHSSTGASDARNCV
jgi:hypothetical protein